MVLDSQGSLAGPDFLVGPWPQTFLDPWETLASLGWMENMVSRVLQVLQDQLAQARLRETEGTLVSQDSQAPPAGKENQDSLEAPDCPAVPVSKEHEVKLVIVEGQVSRVSPVIQVTLEAKDPRGYKGLLVVRVFLESRCHHPAPLDNSETQVFQVKTEDPVGLESPVSPACPDVQVQRVVRVLWVNWAGLEPLVFPDQSGIPDPLASLDPVENKVFLVQSVFPGIPATSAAVTVSATLW